MRLVAVGILAAGYLFLAVQTVLSLRWPLAHDGAFLHFIAFQIDQYGLTPYADIYENSLPLVYLFHLAIGKTLGYGDLAFQAVNVAFLGGLLLATWRMLRPFGGLVAAAAALVFGLVYQSYGPTLTLQRDAIALLPIVVGIILAGRRGRWRFLALGALFGLAASIKPHLVILLPPVWAYALLSDEVALDRRRRDWHTLVLTALLTGVGLGLVIVLPVLWAWQAGGLAAFRGLLFEYVPLYNQLTGVQQLLVPGERWSYLLQSAARLGGRPWLLLPGVVGVALSVMGERPAGQRRLAGLLATLALLAVVYTALAGKFWSYHWMPFFYFAACCGALALLQRQEGAPARRQAVALGVFVVGLALTLRPAPDTYRHLRGLAPARPAGGRAEVMVDYLRPALRPGDTVQPLDGVTGGGAIALLRLGLPSATPYINDTQFYHHPDHLLVQGLRADFLARLEANPPRFLIDVPDASRPTGPGTADFPELARFIAARYRVALDRQGVVIYEREAAQ